MDSIDLLQEKLRSFSLERDWDKFHSPKNLIMALTGEVGELSEIFQWLSEKESKELDKNKKSLVEDELADIAAGKFTELNPTAYLTQPLIKDALAVTVSEDKNTVTATVEGAFTSVQTFTGSAGSEFNYQSEYTSTGEDDSSSTSIWSEVSSDNGLDIPDVIVNQTTEDPWGASSTKLKFVPVDDQVEEEAGFGIADRINVYQIWGQSINAEGQLIDSDGNVIEFSDQSAMITSFDSYDSFDWTLKSWGTYQNPLPFNPLAVANALDIYKAQLLKDSNYRGAHFIEGIGLVEIDLDEEAVKTITANATTKLDGYNIEADDNNLLEDEDTFLDVNAALTLEAILGDYQVKLQLSGERSALEDGTFDLDMSYRLPGADTQRSFTAHYNTEEEGRLTANNADGVVLVLNEPDEDATGTQVLGQILVGPTAIVAATIEDRDGAIFIVYADIDNDGIQEEESL